MNITSCSNNLLTQFQNRLLVGNPHWINFWAQLNRHNLVLVIIISGSFVTNLVRLLASGTVTYRPRRSPTFSRKTNVITPRIRAIRSRSTIVIFMIV